MRDRRVFPAPAGINHIPCARHWSCTRVPRASGDKPAMGLNGDLITWCSPRQRG
ncbi:TPA: hypothetical protein H1T85_002902 [Salmonella enterica]|nr:hypothetical protein [Salmonella enterica subsp. enterica serovar Goldcoast]EHB9363335.1 hypothetical protein [Salmonella enterica]EGG0885511.1 hypothetical protein [Salmonella enterica subsp. enterica serovar Goldcoast]EHD5397733.1 hypothetical protein [Salmonella enterica subsp. enterica serovar Goldcoast]EHI8743673.1 hypothetical protein [Salmonella enterica]